jgi:hypothetical protein
MMADPLPSDSFMRAILGEVFMVQPNGMYANNQKISNQLTRESVASEPCKCVRCSTRRKNIRWFTGYDTEPCEDCNNGIVEPCSRCEYLEELDREP